MNLRLLALGGVAVCVVALPLAVASAGPVGDEGFVADREQAAAADAAAGKAARSAEVSAENGAEGTAERSGADDGRDDAQGNARDNARDTDDGTAADPADSTADHSHRRDEDADAKASHAGRGPRPGPVRSPLLLGLGLATAARCGPELTSPDGIEAQTCVLTQGEDTWARTYFRNATGGALDTVLSLMGPDERTVQTHCLVGAEDEPATCETPRERSRGQLDAYTAVAEFAKASAREGEGSLLLRSGNNSEAHTGS
ncbi:hypothetical protein [Streptomyces griseus]|uniref:hypothetical protein n=1 Tax=Streptomyces griseus TaxID=1911 RepID=UPI00056C796C